MDVVGIEYGNFFVFSVCEVFVYLCWKFVEGVNFGVYCVLKGVCFDFVVVVGVYDDDFGVGE